MKKLRGPFPSPSLPKQLGTAMVPLMDIYSGELTDHIRARPLGAAVVGGRVSDVWLSVQESGKDDSNTLSVEADVLINGVSCFGTKPKIAHVSGEASQQKTTAVTGDTGIVQSVMGSSNSFNVGDVLSYEFDLTRTASPTTEMRHVVIVVELEPAK